MRDWGLGTRDWGLGAEILLKYLIPNTQSPIPNPQYPNEVDKRLVSIVNNLVANVIE